MKVVAEIAAGACALVFMAAALGKLDGWRRWAQLTEDISGPPFIGRFVRFAVPGVEGTIVVLSYASPTVGLAAGAVALGSFAAGVSLLARQLAGRECNCFGAIAPGTIGPHLATRNSILALAAIAAWYTARRENLQALSLGMVVATLLLGAIALMAFHYWLLRDAARAVARGQD